MTSANSLSIGWLVAGTIRDSSEALNPISASRQTCSAGEQRRRKSPRRVSEGAGARCNGPWHPEESRPGAHKPTKGALLAASLERAPPARLLQPARIALLNRGGEPPRVARGMRRER